MRKASFADMNCSIAQALEIVGEWWTPLIVRDALLGVRRFDDFVERLGIARNVLASRLDTLIAAGILGRHARSVRIKPGPGARRDSRPQVDDVRDCSTRRDETRNAPPLPTHQGAS